MADSALQTLYRQEFIAKFEKRQSLLRHTVVTEYRVHAGSYVFVTSGSGDATAVTRGIDARIPSRAVDLDQTTVTMAEWHDKPIRTDFNIMASQGDTGTARRAMQTDSLGVINRKIDSDIHTALDEATVTWGGAATATLLLIVTAKTKLANAFADDRGEDMYAVITPAYHGYLMQLTEFTSADFINLKPFEGVSKSKAFNWYGVNWIVDPKLPGVGTASAKCFMYNKNAIGHACDMQNLQSEVGYDREDAYSYARTSTVMGSRLLQNSGIIEMTHNDSAIS